jgi:cytochrome c oxidase subunit 2
MRHAGTSNSGAGLASVSVVERPTTGRAGSFLARHLPRPVSRRWLPLFLLAPLALAGCQVPAFGAYKGSTAQGQDAFKLWQGFFIAGLFVFVLVFLLILWAVVRYRRAHSSDIPAQTQYHRVFEIAYTVIPIVSVLVLFYFTVITENEVDALPATNVNITVTAFQWGWQFYYPATGKVVVGETTEAPQMVVPTGENVAITLVSADTIHGFYVPQFNFSRYAQPGVSNHFTFRVMNDGVYRGQCTQFCGLYHSLMFFSVRSVSPAIYQLWVHTTNGANPSIGQLKAQIHSEGPGS